MMNITRIWAFQTGLFGEQAVHVAILDLRRLRQEVHYESEVSLGYRTGCYLKIRATTKTNQASICVYLC